MVGLILLVVASKHAASSPVRKPLCLPLPQIAGFGTLQNSVEMIRSHRQVRAGSLRIGFSLSLHAGLHRRQDQPFGFNLNVPDMALLMRVYIWPDRSLLVRQFLSGLSGWVRARAERFPRCLAPGRAQEMT
jgi:hypothetical protein